MSVRFFFFFFFFGLAYSVKHRKNTCGASLRLHFVWYRTRICMFQSYNCLVELKINLLDGDRHWINDDDKIRAMCKQRRRRRRCHPHITVKMSVTMTRKLFPLTIAIESALNRKKISNLGLCESEVFMQCDVFLVGRKLYRVLVKVFFFFSQQQKICLHRHCIDSVQSHLNGSTTATTAHNRKFKVYAIL